MSSTAKKENGTKYRKWTNFYFELCVSFGHMNQNDR